MKTRGAVIWDVGSDWKIEDIEVGAPRRGEVLVEWRFAGLCHTEEHWTTGDIRLPRFDGDGNEVNLYPVLGGHEGSGVVLEVGDGVAALQPGDHVAGSFVAACGRCRYCAAGKHYLCDAGAKTLTGGMRSDGAHLHHVGQSSLLLLAGLGTFAQHTTVDQASLVKVDKDLPLEAVAMVSCGVCTGWGAAVQRGGIRVGDVAVVVGAGGLGISAVQGARMAGARRVVAVDPVAFKRDEAIRFGATDAFESMEAALPAVIDMTRGQLADQVVLTPGVMTGELLLPAMSLVGKDGVVVVAAVAPQTQVDVKLNLFELAMWNKAIKGTVFGSLNPVYDIPKLLQHYRDGDLKLDEMITRRYTLDQVNEGYQDLRDGKNVRGVIAF